jgi:hypothetical protein
MTLDFFLHPAEELPPGTMRQLVWELGIEDNTPVLSERPDGTHTIAGAAVSGEASQPLLLRRSARDYFYVDQQGLVTPVALPPPTSWLGQLGLPDPPYCDFTAPEAAVWLLTVNRRSGALEEPILLRWRDPQFISLPRESQEMWRRIASSERVDTPLLQVYIRAWNKASRAG